MKGLNMPGDSARGKEKMVVSTCPGIYPAGRTRKGLNMPGDSTRGKEKTNGGLMRQTTLLKCLAGKYIHTQGSMGPDCYPLALRG